MTRKTIEILLKKIINESLLLEEVSQDKVYDHMEIMVDALSSNAQILHNFQKSFAIGFLKNIASFGSPAEIPISQLQRASNIDITPAVNAMMSAAKINLEVDQDLYDFIEAAMTHFINAVIASIPREIPMWLAYGEQMEKFDGMLTFVNADGSEMDPFDEDFNSEEFANSGMIRVTYTADRKVEFMKMLGSVLLDIAQDRFFLCWHASEYIEFKDFMMGDVLHPLAGYYA